MARHTTSPHVAIPVLALLALLMPLTCYAHPWYWVSKAQSCTAHPAMGYRWHKSPQPDSSISFVMMDSSDMSVQTVCPGASYKLQVNLPGRGAELYITSSIGTFGKGIAPKCPNQAAEGAGSGTYKDTLVFGCTASGSVVVSVSAAWGMTDYFHQASATFPVDASCAVASCAPPNLSSPPLLLAALEASPPPPIEVASPPPVKVASPPSPRPAPSPRPPSPPKRAAPKKPPPVPPSPPKRRPPPPPKKKSPLPKQMM